MGHKGRLTLALAAAAISLATVIPATASAARYAGTLSGGGALTFKTVTRHGKVVRVKQFGWTDLPVACDQGDSLYSATLPFSMRVSSRRFSTQALDVGLTQSVAGKFTRHRRRASGTLNVFGVLGLSRTNCSTGDLAWSAVRR